MATRLAELRCPCGPSKRGRFLCRYRATVLVPAPIEGVEDPAESPNDLVIKCRHCKRFYALVGVRSAADLLTADHVPFTRVGTSAPVAASG